ncbi:MAG: 16S rRNA (cytosine(1402)-N(4))-methyltransferase RsmH [Candidatus Omnitrophica bacterium]|nr:16S rRNA (cytosine(1402)-N(4))-methyltransferase RsmH [Candidatus Omnitrophota bacterium]
MHHPVMLDEAISSLNLKPGYVVLDGTVGGGGHSKEILKRILPGGRLIGLDADQSAIKAAGENLKEFGGNFKLINENFRNLDRALSKENVKSLNAVLLDIGVSSFQLDDKDRGFSLKEEAPLDMRMDRRLETSAYDIINRYKESDLSDIIYKYGEERFSRRIAKRIVEERSKKPIETTAELAAIVRRAAGSGQKHYRIDPATRTFQAIRIVVNDELGALEEGLKRAVSWLDIGARVAVITFHSLEDRIVKNLFKGYAGLGVLKIITKKPLGPSQEEIAANPRSRSGRLRVAERI